MLKFLGFLPENLLVWSTCCCAVSTATWEKLYQDHLLAIFAMEVLNKHLLKKKTAKNKNQYSNKKNEPTPNVLFKTSSKRNHKRVKYVWIIGLKINLVLFYGKLKGQFPHLNLLWKCWELKEASVIFNTGRGGVRSKWSSMLLDSPRSQTSARATTTYCPKAWGTKQTNKQPGEVHHQLGIESLLFPTLVIFAS